MTDTINKAKYRARRIAIESAKSFYDTVVFQGLHRVPRRPPLIVVETTSRCNLKCIMCDHPSMKREKKHMDMSVYTKTIDDMASLGLGRIGLSRFGEPLMHPSIIEMIEYARRRGIRRVSMSTNATLLTERLAEDLIRSGLDDLAISIDGASKETFERIRVGANYDKVVANVERLMEIRKRLGAARPLVRVNAVLMEENKEEYPEILAKWRPIVDGVRVSLMASYGDVQAHSTVGDFNELVKDNRIRPCPQLWTRLVVLAGGETTVCCADYEGKLSVGNISDHTIEELWNCTRIREIRDINFRMDFDKLPICATCVGISKTWIKLMRKTLLKLDGALGDDVEF